MCQMSSERERLLEYDAEKMSDASRAFSIVARADACRSLCNMLLASPPWVKTIN